MRKLFVLFLLITTTYFSEGSTTIQSANSEYAGRKLDFFKYSDPIAKTSKLVFSLEFDENGKCISTVNNKTTDYVFCDFGIYRGMLFLEPNKTINLRLPPLREKSFADQKNPYFSPVSFWFSTEKKDQLNNQVSDFTQSFNLLTDKFFNQLYFRQSKEICDSVTFLLEKKFADVKSETFIIHKKLKIKTIEVDVFRQKPSEYSKIFSDIKPDFWLHPAFISLFDKTFSGQLSFEAKSIKGQAIGTATNKADILYLLKFVKTKYNIDGEMAELALLKMLHDGFYSVDFSKNSIKTMVKSELFTKNSNKIIQIAAIQISEKFNYLEQNSVAPAICLNDLKNQQICTNKTKDKFKYLVFADIEMIVCREQLKYLANIQQKFQKHLQIFVVLRKTELTEMTKFLDENKIQGTILIDENNEFIEKYNIKSFPQCFLLDENHKVKFTETKSPLDGFEQQFGAFIQRELFERQRNQSR